MRRRPRLIQALKGSVTLLFFILIFRQLNRGNTLAVLQQTDLSVIRDAVLLTFLMQVLHVVRWKVVLSVTPLRNTSFITLFRLHFSAFFFQTILPSAASGDLIKGARLARLGPHRVDSASSVLFARVAGLVALSAMGLISVAIHPQILLELPVTSRILLLSVYPALTVAVILLFTPAVPMKKIFFPRGLSKIAEKGERLRHSLRRYIAHPRILWATFALSALIFLIIVLMTWRILQAVGAQAGFMQLLSVLPVITVLTLMPVSVNGAGIREYALRLFFGITSARLLAFAAVFYGATIAVGCLGGLLYLHDLTRAKNTAEKA
ncbi:MAG: lysylphosphatidylglycerol synthase transmembrane domain-containing protein [Fibrobacterota bacterium]